MGIYFSNQSIGNAKIDFMLNTAARVCASSPAAVVKLSKSVGTAIVVRAK